MPHDLDALATHWQWALDAGGRALSAASHELPGRALARHRSLLLHERPETAALLQRIAHEEHTASDPWLASGPVTPRMLGLAAGTQACIFDVDGVLADAGVLHALVWAQVLDDVLIRRTHESNRHFVPFDPVDDYRTYIDGRPRLEGVHLFLASRGIRLPAGDPDDPPDAETAFGVANRKGDLIRRTVHRRGVPALTGARAYLLAAGFAHLERAVVSTSTTTAAVLEHAQIANLLDGRVDGNEGLRARPAPDMLLAACERLGADPAHAVSLTRSGAGLAAARAAGMTAIGVGHGARAEELAAFGAERVVPHLAALVDSHLRALANGSF